MLVKLGGLTSVKREEELSGEDVALFLAFEKMLERKRLAFQLRCRQCNEAGDPDGAWGNNQTTATRYVIECGCTKRVHVKVS